MLYQVCIVTLSQQEKRRGFMRRAKYTLFTRSVLVLRRMRNQLESTVSAHIFYNFQHTSATQEIGCVRSIRMFCDCCYKDSKSTVLTST